MKKPRHPIELLRSILAKLQNEWMALHWGPDDRLSEWDVAAFEAKEQVLDLLDAFDRRI